MINKKGFTLVELLVVIAIIGILSSVAIVNLNSARVKARIASVQGNLSSLIPSVVLCHDAEVELTYDGTADCDGTGTAVPEDGASICPSGTYSTVPTWPDLPGDWAYRAGCNSSYGTGSFTYVASSSDDGVTITCTESGCSRS